MPSVGFAQVALARHSKSKLFLCTRLLATFSVLCTLFSVFLFRVAAVKKIKAGFVYLARLFYIRMKGNRNVFLLNIPMEMDIIEKFKKSKFFSKAEGYMKKPDKMKGLLAVATLYSTKRGLVGVRDDVVLLISFINDTFRGKYRIVNRTSILLAVAAVIYVVSPMDFVPDFILALGLLDDVAIVCWAVNVLGKELAEYKKSKDEK